LLALPTNGMSAVQMIGTQTAMAQALLTGTTTPNGSGTIPTSTPFGTPNTFTLVPPTGAATTPIFIGTPAPGTTPIIIVPTATPGRPATYTLMEGEFPYCIARRFNVNQQELLDLNGLTSSGQGLQPGMQLRIPQTGNPFVGERALHPHPSSYKVTSTDDNIYKVACYYGDVDPTSIIAANSLTPPYTLHLSQVLNIP
jgi:LysM repeat protein